MLHPHRASELNHLFLVIGNGYEWTKRGDLVAVCDDQFYKNGKPMPLSVAVSRVFRNRKKNAEFRRRYDRNQKAREKRAFTHSKSCPIITRCNCGMWHIDNTDHNKWCGRNFPQDLVCNCGAQARIDAAKPQDSKLDKLIEDAIAAMRKAKEADPVGYEQKRLKQAEEFKESKRKWREEKKYEYRVPADIDQRVAYQEPRPGAYDGYNNWYPACQYSKIVTFPDNIKNDWLLGIIEVCRLVISNPPVVTQYANERTIAETLELAQTALDKAVKLAQKRRIKSYSRGIK